MLTFRPRVRFSVRFGVRNRVRDRVREGQVSIIFATRATNSTRRRIKRTKKIRKQL